MLVRAFLPTGFYAVDGCQRRDLDGRNQVWLPNEEATAALGPFIESRLRDHSTTYRTGNRSADWFGPYNCRFSDIQVPIPPSKILNCKQPVKPVNKNFRKRSRDGEIVLSPFENWIMQLDYNNGFTGTKNGKPFATYAFLDASGLGHPAPVGNWCTIGSYQYRGRLRLDYQSFVNMSEVTPYQVGWVDPTHDDMESLSCILHGRDIQSELADHNSRLIDVATAMAEMPETVQSIVDGCKTILRLYKAAKRKEMRLRNRVSGPVNSTETANRQWRKNRQDEADAIADVWLNFRYNITPTKILIEDMIKYHFGLKTEYLRSRKREEYDVELPFALRAGWKTADTMTQEHRIMIKARLSADATKADAYLSANPLVTAWELVPLSFVVDWFLSVGDFFSSLTPVPSVQQGATYSWKIDDTYTFIHEESKARVTMRLNHYKRTVINPSDYCRVYPNVDLTTYRKLDALALSWKLFVRNFFKP